LLKEYFEMGDYELRAETIPPDSEGRIRIVTRDNRSVGEISMMGGKARAELTWQAKYFMYLYYPKDTQLRFFELQKVAMTE
jgi:hypothetical protein